MVTYICLVLYISFFFNNHTFWAESMAYMEYMSYLIRGSEINLAINGLLPINLLLLRRVNLLQIS